MESIAQILWPSRLVILSESQVHIYYVVLDELAYDFCQKLVKQKQKDLLHVHGSFFLFGFQLHISYTVMLISQIQFFKSPKKCRPTFLVLIFRLALCFVNSQDVKHISGTCVSG